MPLSINGDSYPSAIPTIRKSDTGIDGVLRDIDGCLRSLQLAVRRDVDYIRILRQISKRPHRHGVMAAVNDVQLSPQRAALCENPLMIPLTGEVIVLHNHIYR